MSDHLFSWLPLYHDLGFITVLLYGLTLGIKTTLLPTASFLSRPTAWMEGMSEVRATATYAPNFAFGLAARGIESGKSSQLDLSSIRLAGIGGEAVDVATMERFLRVAEPLGFDPGSLLPGYGLAEATCACTVVALGTGVRVDQVDRTLLSRGVAEPVTDAAKAARFVSVGPAMAELELSIRGEDGAALPERSVGEVWVKGPTLMEGYLNDPEATASVMTDAGWLRTGDLGYLVDGELYVTGRAKDMIIVHGQNYFAEDIERVVAEDEDVRKGGCVAFPISDGSSEQVVVAAETKLADDESVEALRRRLRKRVWEQIGLMPADVILLPPTSIPKTTSGKLQRSRARDLYISGAAKQFALGSKK